MGIDNYINEIKGLGHNHGDIEVIKTAILLKISDELEEINDKLNIKEDSVEVKNIHNDEKW